MADYVAERIFKNLSEGNLNGIFSCHGVVPDVEGATLKSNIPALVSAWNSKLGEKEQRVARLHDFFQDLHEFAESKCDVARLAEELAAGSEIPYDLPDGFRAMTPHDQGAFLRLNNEFLWDVLTKIAFAEDASNTRRWTEYNDLPEETPDISSENMRRLEEMLKDHFADDKRCKRCKATNYVRQTQYYFFATLDDKPKYVDVQNADATDFEPTPLVFPFRLIFVYDEVNGEFAIFAELPKKEHDVLAAKIVEILVGHQDELQPIGKPSFNLSKLANRKFDFPTDPADAIDEVQIKAITIAPSDSPQAEITFRHRSRNIHDCIDDFANRTRIKDDNIEIRRATITIKTSNPAFKFKTITFEIGLHTCNLKSMVEAKKQLGKKYIRAWGFKNAQCL